jgi:enoyl-CoA hydratase/carnithine racemase
MDSMVNVIGLKLTDRMLQRGEMVTPKRALEIGLVDELGEDRAEVMRRAVDQYVESA